MVTLGYHDTRPVKMDEMIFMSSAVSRGAKRALLVADMPFMSYQASIEEAIHNAARFVKEGGMDAVKIEGGADFAPTVRALTRAGIPVMGHIGFTPQTTPTAEGYRVQGETAAAATTLVEDARALEEAGAFSIVLEMTASETAKAITDSVERPYDRDRRGRGLRRPDTRPSRHTRAVRQVHAQVRKEVPRPLSGDTGGD